MSTATANREQLRISESATVVSEGASPVDSNGKVLLHLIRPCVGKGRGRHVYEAAMLQRHAEGGHFDGWPMYVDHESPQAQKAAGGLPRSLKDVGGIIEETWWDGSVPAEGRFKQGAVVARVKPVKWVRELIEDDPRFVNVSINTFATGVRKVSEGGQPAYVVEGFAPDGSADWVTRAGAGGKVVKLLEAAVSDGAMTELHELLEAADTDELASWLREVRPELAEALTTTSREREEEDTMDKTELREAVHSALRDEDTKTVLVDIMKDTATTAVTEALAEVLPNAIGRAAEVIEASATAAATAAVRTGQIRAAAAKKVTDAKLPELFEAQALTRVSVLEAEDTVDDEQKVTETAEAKADKATEAVITEAWSLVGSLKPELVRESKTVVTDNGAGGEDDEKGKGKVTESKKDDSKLYRHELKEAGVDMTAAYGLKDKAADDKDKVTA